MKVGKSLLKSFILQDYKIINMLLSIIPLHTLICCYIWKSGLPIEAELGNSKTSESESDYGARISQYVAKMNEFRDKLFSEAKEH